MVKLFFDIHVERDLLFRFGKLGFLFTLSLFSLFMMLGVIDRSDDLKAYFNLS